MNPTDREQIRLSLLRYLDAAAGRRFGLTDAVLLQHIRSEGFPAGDAELDAEIDYLAGKGLIETAAKTISPENRAWKITSAGRDLYAQLQG